MFGRGNRVSRGSLKQDANFIRWNRLQASSVSCFWRRCRPSSSFSFFIFFCVELLRTDRARAARARGADLRARGKSAESLRAAAREKDRAYREALRKARAEIFAEQEAARRVALEERSALVPAGAQSRPPTNPRCAETHRCGTRSRAGRTRSHRPAVRRRDRARHSGPQPLPSPGSGEVQ